MATAAPTMTCGSQHLIPCFRLTLKVGIPSASAGKEQMLLMSGYNDHQLHGRQASPKISWLPILHDTKTTLRGCSMAAACVLGWYDARDAVAARCKTLTHLFFAACILKIYILMCVLI
ncbi:uncharacterized protein LOC119336312 [Triticum dicoccoides]|uniref:uncharacterized protein LOC119336312 n=1 Tax=Triticum dicoccoides TaxID=85692 RepID=UPI001891BB51|nr:uncharacterized protein LOC119336312 [Triticum dicoccoides]